MTNGLNYESIKIKNRSAILKLLNNNKSMSRKDIATSIGLTPASVTQIAGDMIEEGLIVELGEIADENKVGRRKILIDINSKSKSVLCINIEKYITYITLATIDSEIIDSTYIQTNNTIPPIEFLTQIAEISKGYIEKTQTTTIGVGVSVKGVVDSENGISLNCYEVWEEPVDIKNTFEELLGLTVFVENNMKAFTQGEIVFGMGRKYQNLLFVKWYPGVGAAIVIDGKIFSGSNWQVAELGHCTIDPNGNRCKCGKIGCLETFASIDAIKNSIQRIYSPKLTPKLFKATEGDDTKILKIIKKYLKDDNLEIDDCVKECLVNSSNKIALALANAITMLSPEKVILLGKFMENEFLRNNLKEELNKYIKTDDQNYINMSKISDKYYYIGSLSIVMENLLFTNGGVF